jgi:membrane associated rhomboid family serine protease
VFLIPVGNDSGALRRWPVVTIGIIVLCFVAYSAHPPLSWKQEHQVEEAGKKALDYYFANPDLQPEPELRQVVERALASTDAGTRRKIREELEQAEGDSDTRPERQAELDRLSHEWIDPVRGAADWQWGLIPAHFSFWKLLTYMFIHASFLHLFSNMLFFYITAPPLEDVWGRPLFAFFYLAAGVVAGGLFAAQDTSLDIPLVGASGAIAGVMGAFAVRYPKTKIRLMFLTLVFIRPVRLQFGVPAWLLLSLWFAGEFLSAHSLPTYTPLAGGPHVAYWVHVWGFVFGAGAAGALRLLKVEDRFIDDAIANRQAAQQDPVSHQLSLLLGQGRNDEARRLLAAALTTSPNDTELAETFWRLTRLDSMQPYVPLCLRLIRTDLRDKREELAIERWRELCQAVPDVDPGAAIAIPLSKAFERQRAVGEALDVLATAARHLRPDAPADDWARLAEACLVAGVADAEDIALRAVRHPLLTAETRAALEQTIFFTTGKAYQPAVPLASASRRG